MAFGCHIGLRSAPRFLKKRRKLYAYLTYFAGGKGMAVLQHLGEKLHLSRRYVIKLVQELSAHRLIAVTNIYCANVYRFLWHRWMQTAADGDFRITAWEKQPLFPHGA
jgi:hypothetical protein